MRKEDIVKALNIKLDGCNDRSFYCKDCGLLLATGYTRVVIGGRGPYIEFDPKHMVMENIFLTNQYHIYFKEYCSNCQHKIFIYHQLQTVSYADYKIGLFYISPELVSVDRADKKIICIDYNKQPKTLF